jgi:hypothetical protein
MRRLAALAVLALALSSDAPSHTLTSVVPIAGESAVFYISGGVSGLYPGQTANLNLTISNPQGFGITVTSISIYVNSPSAAGCPASYLSAPSTISVNLAVPAGGSAQYGLVTVTLSSAAPDACQGVTFPLVYGGTAVRT